MKPEEEYRLFLELTDRLAERRQTVTTTFVSLNAAIGASAGLILASGQLPQLGRNISVTGLLVAGIVICSLWRHLVIRYSELLGWWYGQLRGLEANMVDCTRLLTKEYVDLYTSQGTRRSFSVTLYEVRLTWLMTAIYATFVLAMAMWLVMSTR